VKAVANVQDALTSYPDLKGLVGLWSYNGPAILSGVRDSGKLGQVKIICFDEEPATLAGVKAGEIVGTIVQQPFQFGYESVKLLVQLAKGDRSGVPAEKQIFIPVRAITAENEAEFEGELARLRQGS
jgi:ribose transport system substrate-binding protein